MVINRVLGGVLQEALAGVADLDILCPASIDAARPGADGVIVTLPLETG